MTARISLTLRVELSLSISQMVLIYISYKTCEQKILIISPVFSPSFRQLFFRLAHLHDNASGYHFFKIVQISFKPFLIAGG